MIQVNELRIGNLLKTKNYNSFLKIRQFLGTETIEVLNIYTDFFEENINDISDFEYIELSEDIFKLFGFSCLQNEDELEVYEKDFDDIDDTIEFLQKDHNSNEYHFVNCSFDVIIKYAHELQNLMYLLTKNELQVVS